MDKDYFTPEELKNILKDYEFLDKNVEIDNVKNNQCGWFYADSIKQSGNKIFLDTTKTLYMHGRCNRSLEEFINCNKSANYFWCIKKNNTLFIFKHNNHIIHSIDSYADTTGLIEVTHMTSKNLYVLTKDILNMFKNDFNKAKYNLVSNQILNLVQLAILKSLENKNSDSIDKIKTFLSSEFGKSFLSLMIGIGLENLDYSNIDENVKKIAQSFRINGMAKFGNEVIYSLFAESTQELQKIVLDLNKESLLDDLVDEEIEHKELLAI